MDQYGLRKEKYSWLVNNDFSVDNYKEIKPKSPWYFFIPRKTSHIQHYLDWPKINDIFPVNSVGVVTSRDKFVIDFDKDKLINRIRNFANLSQPDEIITQAYNLKDKSNWTLQDARKEVSKLDNYEEYIEKISYRTFDVRHIFYYKSLVERDRYNVMRNMLKENIGLVARRQQLSDRPSNYFFISQNIISDGLIRSDNKGSESFFPLYIYPEKSKPGLFDDKDDARSPNIIPDVFKNLKEAFDKHPSPEEILYYIYAIFYSNIYRDTYEEFLNIDFPRVPFTADYELFQEMAKYGQKLADLHLLKSAQLDSPIVKYQGQGDNDRIEKYDYDKEKHRIYINSDKYFEGVTPELWNYYIGGYQVLRKYLKDRKGRNMEDGPRYCRIATALNRTINIQEDIDKIYPLIEDDIITL